MMFRRKISNLTIFKKTVKLSAVVFLFGLIIFVIFEPAIMNASTNTNTITLTANVSQEVTISSPGNTSFSGSIPGVSGNPGLPVTASSTWKVITNNPTGFIMTLNSSQSPALYLDGNYYFNDYGTSPGTPVYGWSVPTVNDARFGFTVEPATTGDIASTFLSSGSACGSGSYNADACWAGFNGTTPVTIINRHTLTDANGQSEVVKFNAESNARLLETGNYTATITATASLQ